MNFIKTMLDCLPPSPSNEYLCSVDLNLYDSPDCTVLATQAAKDRYLVPITSQSSAMKILLLEDGYEAWLPQQDWSYILPATTPFTPKSCDRTFVLQCLPDIIAFTLAAKTQANYYLWGGNRGPNYDCSGLIQAAFAASGIWLPRDSYQQEAFCHKIAPEDLQKGDLIFFAKPPHTKVDHVALYLGDGYYIHSSGPTYGRNGIAIDPFSEEGDQISTTYFRQYYSCGRVIQNYSIANKPR